MQAHVKFLTVVAMLLARPALAAEEPVLNIYNWADYIAQETLDQFEAEFGIEINYDTYDSSDVVDAKLLAGRTGYDIIAHDSRLVARLLPLGVFSPIDRSKLSNWKNLDPEFLELIGEHDPGNKYMVPYFWGSTGWAYNVDMVRERLPDVDVEDASFVFEPKYLEKLADCGVSYLSSATSMVPLALAYLGHEQDTGDPAVFEEVEQLLKKARPYIKYFDSTRMIQDLPSGEVCVALSWSGDYAQASNRAITSGIDINLDYAVPRQGSIMWIDGFVVPADAPHPENAHKFLDFILRPEVIAKITDLVYYANAVPSSYELIDPKVLGNEAAFPPKRIRDLLFLPAPLQPKEERAHTRLFARVKAGI